MTAVQTESQAMHGNLIYCTAMCNLEFSANVCAMQADTCTPYTMSCTLAHLGGATWEPIHIPNMGVHSPAEYGSTFRHMMGSIACASREHLQNMGAFAGASRERAVQLQHFAARNLLLPRTAF